MGKHSKKHEVRKAPVNHAAVVISVCAIAEALYRLVRWMRAK